MDASLVSLIADLRAKLTRADVHLEELRSAVRTWAAKPPHVFRGEIEPERGRYVAYLALTEPPPVELSVIVGDLVHNWHSALDHFACGILPKITRSCCFPIYDDPDEFARSVMLPAKTKRPGPLTGLPVESVGFALIERAQPYHGLHGAKFHPLHSLRKLSNEDKHRAILTRAIGVAEDPVPKAAIRRMQDVEVADQFWVNTGRPLEDCAEVFGADIRIIGPNPEMEVHYGFQMDVAFGREMVTLRALSDLRTSVTEIIETAAKLVN